ncbi:MAG: hypothetical protein J6M65_01055 [Eubacterium sp.]|nr:hypothetical protein [Eubacterium sp.]
MSQAKVDKYKKEKKNRSRTMKLNKIKKAVAIFVVALGIGAIVGIPLGKYIYKEQKAAEARNATIKKDEYDAWFDKKWAGEYSDLFASVATAGDASATEADEESADDEVIELDEDEIEVEE